MPSAPAGGRRAAGGLVGHGRDQPGWCPGGARPGTRARSGSGTATAARCAAPRGSGSRRTRQGCRPGRPAVRRGPWPTRRGAPAGSGRRSPPCAPGCRSRLPRATDIGARDWTHDRARVGDGGKLDGVRGRGPGPGASRRRDPAARHGRRGGGRGAGRVHRTAGPGRGRPGRAARGHGRDGGHGGPGGRGRPAGPPRAPAAPPRASRARGGAGGAGRGPAHRGAPGRRRGRSQEPGQGGPVRGRPRGLPGPAGLAGARPPRKGPAPGPAARGLAQAAAQAAALGPPHGSPHGPGTARPRGQATARRRLSGWSRPAPG